MRGSTKQLNLAPADAAHAPAYLETLDEREFRRTWVALVIEYHLQGEPARPMSALLNYVRARYAGEPVDEFVGLPEPSTDGAIRSHVMTAMRQRVSDLRARLAPGDRVPASEALPAGGDLAVLRRVVGRWPGLAWCDGAIGVSQAQIERVAEQRPERAQQRARAEQARG